MARHDGPKRPRGGGDRSGEHRPRLERAGLVSAGARSGGRACQGCRVFKRLRRHGHGVLHRAPSRPSRRISRCGDVARRIGGPRRRLSVHCTGASGPAWSVLQNRMAISHPRWRADRRFHLTAGGDRQSEAIGPAVGAVRRIQSARLCGGNPPPPKCPSRDGIRAESRIWQFRGPALGHPRAHGSKGHPCADSDGALQGRHRRCLDVHSHVRVPLVGDPAVARGMGADSRARGLAVHPPQEHRGCRHRHRRTWPCHIPESLGAGVDRMDPG